MKVIESILQKSLNERNTRKIAQFNPGLMGDQDSRVRLLICLPFDYAHFYTALRVFLPVIRQHPAISRLVVTQALFPLIKEIDPDLLIPLIVTRIDEAGFPTDPDLLAIMSAELVVAIDLNLRPSVTSAAIVARSRAHIRAGFQTEFSEDLFNLILTCKSDNLVENVYRRIWTLVQPEILKSI